MSHTLSEQKDERVMTKTKASYVCTFIVMDGKGFEFGDFEDLIRAQEEAWMLSMMHGEPFYVYNNVEDGFSPVYCADSNS